MQRLERVVVQMTEAQRLANFDDVPHGRLALLLLDNAAETMLMWQAGEAMQSADFYDGVLRQLNAAGLDNDETRRLRGKFEPKGLSKGGRQRVQREYNALVDYVFGQSEWELDSDFADCLKILHRFRNAAYHRDEVRPEILSPAVQIYFYLCCQVMLHQRFMIEELAVAPPAVAAVFRADALTGGGPSGAHSTAALRALVAENLLADMTLDHEHVAAALSLHLTGRLDALNRDLASISTMAVVTALAVTLRLVQMAPTEPAEFDAEPAPDFWTRSLPVTPDVLIAWRTAAADIARRTTAQSALRAFAAVEDPLSKFEEPVARFVEEIEREVQREIDIRRGK